MTHPFSNLLRGLALAGVLMAGSCAAPSSDPNRGFEDGAANHPIEVEPSYQSLKLFYSPADHGLTAADAPRFDAFVADYQAHGNGSIAISAPSGIGAQVAVTYFAQRLNEMGVSRDHILVATHDAPNGDLRVEINYVSYEARTAPCGDWSENLDFTLDNSTPKNFGCSVQQNIAAQVADPRDLIGPRAMDGSDANRRAAVVGHYEKGEVTEADKHMTDKSNEQAAPGASDVQ